MAITGLQVFKEENKADAFAVIQARFSSHSCRRAEKYLQNPFLSSGGAGDIAYMQGKPVGFQAAIRRKLFLGKEPLWGVVGGMLAMYESAPPVLLVNLMKASIASRDGSSFFYANTANFASMKMNRMLGVKGTGPSLCERIIFGIVYVPKWLKWICRRPHARRLSVIDAKVFDDFWNRYRETNDGLVSSRSAEELKWIFGDRLESGEIVILGEFSGDTLVGYVALKSSCRGKRWIIADWIAVKNNAEILSSLVQSAVRFLRRQCGPVLLETIGFPDFAEPILKRCLWFSRKAKNNTFIWKFLDERMTIPPGSWFFGPYDGDRCM